MTNKISTNFLRTVLAVFAFAILTSGLAQAQETTSFDVYGLTVNNQLIRFKNNNPNTIESAVSITGLQPGETLLGIDFRPANGMLYGLGSTSRIYVINPAGVATAVNGPFTPALQGTEFGFDFNPVPDRIRIISNTGQNLRVHPDTGLVAFVDGNLNINGATRTSLVGAAYTNPDVDPNTGTTLYDIETDHDFLVIQDPPNSGTLRAVGPLGVDAGQILGFDIGTNFGRHQPFGLAAIQVSNGTSRLFAILLDTGQSFDIGQIGNGTLVRGLAIDLVSNRNYR